MDLLFATNNPHKLKEIQRLVSPEIRIFSLADKNIAVEIPEDHFSLEENALQKARFIYERTGMNCFADDTGLEVYSLDGEPGVFSARYSRMGDLQFPDLEINEGNIKKLLHRLKDKENREARFRTVISLIVENQEYYFEGIAKGSILKEKRGSEGFGYDPVFLPEGYTQCFAEMSLSEKNKISHRGKAISNLVTFLNQLR